MILTYKIETREQWLAACAELLAHGRFAPQRYDVPEVRISVGFPSGTKKSGAGAAIGQCWYAEAAEDGIPQIFISPVLTNAVQIAHVLAHELVHATVGAGHGHGKVFRKCAVAIGLTGKMTATVATPEFEKWIKANILKVLGIFPHGKLNTAMAPTKKQSTRMLKCVCGECGYTARTTAKWLNDVGAPLCPCNSEPMEVKP
jgi:SprT-like family.